MPRGRRRNIDSRTKPLSGGIQYHEYGGVRIPVMTSKSARPFYNLPDDEIDKLKQGTNFDKDGSCMEPGGFRATPFGDRFDYFGEQEIRERAEFLERNKSGIFFLFCDNNVPVKYQNGLPSCWGYGACTVDEAACLVAGDDYIEKSPDSVCAPVTGGRARGGWASEWLKYSQEEGIVPASMWKQHDMAYRKYQTPEIEAARQKHKTEEWVDIPSGDMLAMQTVLAKNKGGGMGWMWWGHLVAVLGLAFSDKFGPLYLFRNSHGSQFGLDGWCFATESVAKHGGGSTVYSSRMDA